VELIDLDSCLSYFVFSALGNLPADPWLSKCGLYPGGTEGFFPLLHISYQLLVCSSLFADLKSWINFDGHQNILGFSRQND